MDESALQQMKQEILSEIMSAMDARLGGKMKGLNGGSGAEGESPLPPPGGAPAAPGLEVEIEAPGGEGDDESAESAPEGDGNNGFELPERLKRMIRK